MASEVKQLAQRRTPAGIARLKSRLSAIFGRRGVVSVCIDAASLSISVVKPHNGHFRVELSVAVPLEKDALADPSAAGAVVRRVLDGRKGVPRSLVVGLGADLTFERPVVLPPMTPVEMDQAVSFQADRVMPFPAGEMRIDYAVESTAPDGLQSVVLSGVTEATAQKVIKLAAAANLQLKGLFSASTSLYTLLAAGLPSADREPRAIVYSRAGGVEVSVGRSAVPVMSRFVRGANPDQASSLLEGTAAAAQVSLGPSSFVFACEAACGALSGKPEGFRVVPLEDSIENQAGLTPESPCSAASLALGILAARGVSLPNFFVSGASQRRRKAEGARGSRLVRLTAAAAAVVIVALGALAADWALTLRLERRAAVLAAANSKLKNAVARASTAQPWLSGRSVFLDSLALVSEIFPESSSSFVKSLSVAESGKASVQGRVSTPQQAYDLVAGLSRVKGFQNVRLDSGAADASGGYNFTISFEIDKWRQST